MDHVCRIERDGKSISDSLVGGMFSRILLIHLAEDLLSQGDEILSTGKEV